MIECTGCGVTAEELVKRGEYESIEDARSDGTYANDKFVCTCCYVKLIPMGLDVGSPAMIQFNARTMRSRDK